MKNAILLLVLLLFSGFVKAQNNNAKYIESVIKRYNNDSVSIYFAYNVKFYNPDGSLKEIKDIIDINNDIFLFKRVKNKCKIIKLLLTYFNDPERDWLANSVLYYITRQDATPLFAYRSKHIDEWKKQRKKEDYQFWMGKLDQCK
jgi:hypothetical protein